MGTDFEYHKAPEKTAEAHLEPGVFTTGDIGFLDEDGYLWLSDRKIDMIIFETPPATFFLQSTFCLT